MIRPTFAALTVLLCLAGSTARADETIALSSLDLAKATQGFGKTQANLSIDGHPLTLGGVVHASGVGTHAPGTIAVRLGGAATRFTATVGIDDEVGPGKGSAEFEVIGDGGRMLYRSGVLRYGATPKTVDVDLKGIQRVILHVTDGGDGYEFDHTDWADAQFTVTGSKPETVALPVADPVISMAGPAAAPRFNEPSAVAVRAGAPMLWTPPVTGGRPLTFTARGLPKGVTLNPATGTLTGALAAGRYAIALHVRNRAGSADRTVILTAGATISQTPAMGWNSYDAYGDAVNEAQTLANARYLRDKMQPYGWDTVVIDYRWYDPEPFAAPDNGRVGETLSMDANGRLTPAITRFPSAAKGAGFRALADQLHAMGLKFGIHIMRGIPRNAVKANLPIEGSTYTAADAANTADLCSWCADMYGVRGATPAGRAYYDSLFRLYASWGLDFVKMDDTSAPYHTDEIEAVRAAIDKSGRSILYSLSPGETPIADASHVIAHANMWRVSGDFWDSWNALSHEFSLGARWHDFAGPGHWPDADMLPLGHLSIANRPVGKSRHTNFTHPEQMTLLSLWSLLPSPLMVGACLPDNDPWTLALLTNPEVLAVDQDSAGTAGTRVAGGEAEVWARTLADGSRAVGLFNAGDLDTTVTVNWSDLKIAGRYRVRDLWLRRDLGAQASSYAATVPAHGAVLLRLSKITP
jgi:alpha-galactosidase